jgi:hypothetical protein
MKRLRHPVRAIREPFGTAGLIVACVAMVLALTGAAFAAGALTGKQKKEVEKIAKKFAGKPGAPGATGPQGPAGPAGKDGGQGEKGAKGDTGSPGAPGTPGTPGEDGESAQVARIAPGDPECEGQGGALVFVPGGEEEEICNGSPWVPDGTLPPGAVETGTWVVVGPGEVFAPISFTVPMPGKIESEHIYVGSGHERKNEEASTGQPAPETEFEERCGSTFRSPTGILPVERPTVEKAGNLCVYLTDLSAKSLENVATQVTVTRRGTQPGAGPSGAYLNISGAPSATLYGSYAVKGCSPALPEGDVNKCP